MSTALAEFIVTEQSEQATQRPMEWKIYAVDRGEQHLLSAYVHASAREIAQRLATALEIDTMIMLGDMRSTIEYFSPAVSGQ